MSGLGVSWLCALELAEGAEGRTAAPGVGSAPLLSLPCLPRELAQGSSGFAVKGKKLLLNLGKKKGF